MRLRYWLFGLCTALLAASGTSFSQSTASPNDINQIPGPGSKTNQGAMSAVSPIDQKFVQNSTAYSYGEIKLGQLAVERGTSKEVKAFGRQLIDDHTAVNSQLRQIAGRQGIGVSMELDPKLRADYERLSQLSGPEFDRMFWSTIRSEHRDAISMFQDEAHSGQNSELRDFAKRTLPALREHAVLAQQNMERRPM